MAERQRRAWAVTPPEARRAGLAQQTPGPTPSPRPPCATPRAANSLYVLHQHLTLGPASSPSRSLPGHSSSRVGTTLTKQAQDRRTTDGHKAGQWAHE